MKAYTNDEIAAYYDTTEVHYKRGWDLRHSLAMHYGYWDEKATTFRASLGRMNEALATFGGLSKEDKVLDAGCGIGGTSIFLADTLGCHVTGITLSQQQVETARGHAATKGVQTLTCFEQADFRATPFPAETFDVVWALESAVYDPEKADFCKEAYRLLRPGGRLVMGEYIKSPQPMKPRDKRIFHRWLDAWAIHDLSTLEHLAAVAKQQGFEGIKIDNVTPAIRKSSWRMFYGSLFLTVLSAGYRLFNPKVSHFADNHHKGLRYQYPALRRGLWQYYFICLRKD